MSKPIKSGAKVKEIGWAYPASENAALFGHGATGCYVLKTGTWPNPLEAVAGCADGASPLLVLGARYEGEWTPQSMFH